MQISGDLKIQYFHISDDIFIAFGATLPPFCGRTQVKHNISNSAPFAINITVTLLGHAAHSIYIIFPHHLWTTPSLLLSLLFALPFPQPDYVIILVVC